MAHGILLFFSGQDMIIIGAIALLLFGGKKIPEFAKGLGEGIRHFKDASEGKTDEKTTPKDDSEKKA
jgi:sec-independent protein translocase protein TatA